MNCNVFNRRSDTRVASVRIEMFCHKNCHSSVHVRPPTYFQILTLLAYDVK